MQNWENYMYNKLFKRKGEKMSSCLGLYIEKNLIKYAKVNIDHETVKVDSFDVKFYDKLSDAIKQIIDETNSYNTPICVNLLNEKYYEFDIFSLLSKADIPRVIETEFQSICDKEEYNINALEYRNLIVKNIEDREKLKVILISANKTEISNKVNLLGENNFLGLVSLPICISTLVNSLHDENAMIVNIEEKTTLTTIVEGKIYDIKVLNEGSKDFLDQINKKENSYSKAYNICKNTTIFTSINSDLKIDQEENDYLDEIMPTLYNILSRVKENIEKSSVDIQKVYITGTGAVISNIDLYFNEYIGSDVKVEILKPYFVTSESHNLKDYIEVNSAIALALGYLGMEFSGINFRKNKISKVYNLLKKDDKNIIKIKGKLKKKNKELIDKYLYWFESVLIIIILAFLFVSGIITGNLKNKNRKAEDVIADTNSQISTIKDDIEKIKSKINSYEILLENINSKNGASTEKTSVKNSIPNLLNEIINIIPKEVQLVSIENTSSKHIKIIAQSDKYEQLGYFKVQLKNQEVLLNVTSDQGTKNGDFIIITIEGDLP